MSLLETIFAQSSGYGKSGITVYRISGPQALFIVKTLSRKSKIKERYMYFVELRTPNTDELIDQCMIVYFKKPNSFTGEDVVELHMHGSIAISKKITEVVLSFDRLRLAHPGEFSKRAFLNQKMDLVQADGLVDLINCETYMQHKQAIKQVNGGLSKIYDEWRNDLIKIIAHLESYIDFPEDEIPSNIAEKTKNNVDSLCSKIEIHLHDSNRGEKLKNGINLAIIGPPNVGKSSLINYITQKDTSIVSEIPGTTRDIIESYIDISGYPICLMDTAGIRNTDDIIETQGVNKSLLKAKEADIKLLLLDTDYKNIPDFFTGIIDLHTIVVINKIDICNKPQIQYKADLQISVKEKINLELLVQKITEKALEIAGLCETPYITRTRYKKNLEAALFHLKNFNLLKDLVLATEDIRMAIRSLSFITGQITVDEILGEIFTSFCIGK